MNREQDDIRYSIENLRLGTTEIRRKNSDPVLPIEKPEIAIPNSPPPKVQTIPDKLSFLIKTSFPQETSPLTINEIENLIRRYIAENRNKYIDNRNPDIVHCQHTILEEILSVPYFHTTELKYYLLRALGGDKHHFVLK